MSLQMKRIVIAVLAGVFLLSLLLVQWTENIRRQEESGQRAAHVVVPLESRECVECHEQETPGITAHWTGSTHAEMGVGCLDCHKAEADEPDAFKHEGTLIATMVTPLDCKPCHEQEFEENSASHHAKAGNILDSLDNTLAETVEGARLLIDLHGGPLPGTEITQVSGFAFANTGCQQCHGSKVALQTKEEGGEPITVDDLAPDENGKPTNQDAVDRILKDEDGKPLFATSTWPNTGIGRINLDGSRGSCSACHSRHDFSPRRARQPENCGKCHLGPDHPQKEIYEESKHGIAYRDMKDQMNLDAEDWVLGEDYTAAPTCATCHMSGNIRNKGKISHDPGRRISWTNRPPVSRPMDTDAEGNSVAASDPAERKKLIVETADVKRSRMKDVCAACHTSDYVNGFYSQYDEFVTLYNEKFGLPSAAINKALKANGLLTPTMFDEEFEWTYFYLWHHEGRRARHGASMMAPDYAHWHGTYEVAERFYMELIPQARELIEHARAEGKTAEADAVEAVVEEILARPEHAFYEQDK